MRSGLIRTLRIRTRRKFGNLGMVTTTLGDAGVVIGEIQTVRIGHAFTVRDFHLTLDDEEHLAQVCAGIDALADAEVLETINHVLAVHRGGKIRTQPRVKLSSMHLLQTAYDPGVKEIVGLIDDDAEMADVYTGVQRTVAIVSDGAGMFGVGRVRSRAMLPVLEAKAALLASAAGLSGLPLVLDVNNEDEFVETVRRFAPSCGGILLDAISSPRGLRVQQRLREELEMPIFDDDSDGPAVAVLAAVINVCRRQSKSPSDVTIGQIGLGTAGGAIASLMMHYTGRSVLGEDVHPAAMSRHVFNGGVESSLEEIMKTCDIVVANTGHGDVISPELVRDGQVILALSEPRPEIDPYDAALAGAAYAADGKAVSKAVVFPGLLLGAMAVRSRAVNVEMQIAAATTLAEHAEHQDLVPTPLSEGVHARVASAVAAAAIESKVARDVDVDTSTEVFEDVIADRRQLPLRTG